jgi:hypothetical protein
MAKLPTHIVKAHRRDIKRWMLFAAVIFLGAEGAQEIIGAFFPIHGLGLIGDMFAAATGFLEKEV